MLRAINGGTTGKSSGTEIWGVGIPDLSGTRIRVVNSCKKIAVFGGSQHGSGINDPYTNGDHGMSDCLQHIYGVKLVSVFAAGVFWRSCNG